MPDLIVKEIEKSTEFSNLLLREDTEVQDGSLININDLSQERASLVLSRAKKQFFKLWGFEPSLATIEEVAEAYEITVSAIAQILADSRHGEFDSDIHDGQWTARAAIRLAMRLSNPVAVQIQNILLSLTESIFKKEQRKILAEIFQLDPMTSTQRAATIVGVSEYAARDVKKQEILSGNISSSEYVATTRTRNGNTTTYLQQKRTPQSEAERQEKMRSRKKDSEDEPAIRVQANLMYPEIHPGKARFALAPGDLAIALSQLCSSDIELCFKRADQWLSDEQVQAVYRGIAHRI